MLSFSCKHRDYQNTKESTFFSLVITKHAYFCDLGPTLVTLGAILGDFKQFKAKNRINSYT